MLTQCPDCQTVFRVTPPILRAAHGQVRCGRCNMQFDAIEQLLDADEQDIAATQTALKSLDGENSNADAQRATAEASDNQRYSGTAVAHEDIVLEGNRIEISGVYPSATDSGDNDLAHSRTFIEEINLGSDEWNAALSAEDPASADADADAELDDVETVLSETELAGALNSLDQTVIGNESSAPAAAPPKPRSLADVNPWLSPRHTTADEPLFDTPPALRRWPWAIASLILCLLLVAQALHHYRQQLARHPGYGSLVTRLYAAVGQPLSPQWDLNAYGVQQWGMVSDPQSPGTLRVRASVTNSAAFAQPYPLVQITLEDRFGSKVGSRAFKPDEYLGSQAQATRLLAAGESANIDLAIVDPGDSAVGFQFDTCLNSSAGLRCTHSGS